MLSFRLGSIPVRLHVSFLLTAAFLAVSWVGGSAGGPDALTRPLVLIVLIAFSVLLHELGHALVGRLFGRHPEIDLQGFGGVTSWRDRARLSNGRQIVVSLAGPLAGMLLAGALVAFGRTGAVPATGMAAFALDRAIVINLVWGIFNLMPVLPMDGGNILRSFLNIVTGGRGERPTRIVSLVLCALGIAWALRAGSTINALLIGLFAWTNVQALRVRAPVPNDAEMREHLKQAYAALEREDANTAARHARQVLEEATDASIRIDAVRLLAFALLLLGAWGPLMQLMEQGAARVIGDEEMDKFERAANELGRHEEARRLADLRSARQAPPVSPLRA